MILSAQSERGIHFICNHFVKIYIHCGVVDCTRKIYYAQKITNCFAWVRYFKVSFSGIKIQAPTIRKLLPCKIISPLKSSKNIQKKSMDQAVQFRILNSLQ